jgi:dienelactone hydrolase
MLTDASTALRRALRAALLCSLVSAFALASFQVGPAHARARPSGRAASALPATGGAGGPTGQQAPPPPSTAVPAPPFAVGVRVLRLLDSSRAIHLAGGRTQPRALLTVVRYPAVGAPGDGDVFGARAAPGPFPLVVFGHGFATTPTLYARLLQSWARAGYVVAAPVFPLENANAPGGPDESDLVNQPTDMSFVISRLLAQSASASGSFHGLIDPAQVAVAGHSDGAETALALAYSRKFRDRRVRAAVILSGAEMPGVGGFSFAPGSPALLAVQGTADAINEPRFTYAFFKLARRPKYLLRLLGAGHLAPYTDQQPQLGIVQHVSVAFLDRYLKRILLTGQQLRSLASGSHTAALLAEP